MSTAPVTTTTAVRAGAEASVADAQVMAASRPAAAERFRQLMSAKPAADLAARLADGEVAELDRAQFFARSQARQALWSLSSGQAGQSTEQSEDPQMPYASNKSAHAGKMSSSFASSESFEPETTLATAASAESADRKPVRAEDSSKASAAGLTQPPPALNVAQAVAPASPRAPSAPAESQAFGDLAELLSRHCEGVYVGTGAPGSVGRVMLRLTGALSGVSVEIASEAAGLLVRMHVPDAARWQSVASHTEELERLLAHSSGVPVRVEAVVGGGRS